MRGVGRAGGGAPAGGAVGGAVGGVRGGRTGGGFSLPAAGSGAGAGVAAVAPAGPLGLGLLALQEGGEAARRDAAARQRAESLLEELAGLQLDLLAGGVDPARLERLAALTPGDAGADPELQVVVQGVVLRAHVEIARRGGNLFVSAE
ncbi:hypothetical protein GCM10011504_04530 [Siccirubricoccus deserti]|uniref:Uncharacterized protein n=1 Tax=Siccirubricoccus deserti TaxID=2013562 RepID=A0A9X0UES2_9PROT|nr:flagellar assembly protein FliX [Siccirubricoccus deserti]MBC4013780.1 hypothetical protein [Siccirubricoccus deserti]GGC29387.1 hypothetical protein GCM10011504_04530 [Siccirubricoccus deserti]